MITESFTARVLDNLTGVGQTLNVNANQAFNLQTVATLVAQDPTRPGRLHGPHRLGRRLPVQRRRHRHRHAGIVRDPRQPHLRRAPGHDYPITVYITDKLGSETVAHGEADVTFVPPPQSSGTAPAPNPPGTPAGPQPPEQHHPAGLVRQPRRHADGAGRQALRHRPEPRRQVPGGHQRRGVARSRSWSWTGPQQGRPGDRLHRSRGRVRRHRLQPGRLEALRLGRRHVLRPGRHARPEGLV